MALLWAPPLLDASAPGSSRLLDDADAYLLLDQEPDQLQQAGGAAECSRWQQQQQQSDAAAVAASWGLSSSLLPVSGWMSMPVGPGNSACATNADTQAARTDQAAANTSAVAAGGAAAGAAAKGGKAGGNGNSAPGVRKCTSLAQREAHKRYREKKKQSIAAMEAAVLTKRHELLRLQAENEQLKSKARVLETAERCSVEIHELMMLLDGLQSLSEEGQEEEGGQRSGGGRSGSATSLAHSYDSNAGAAADGAAAAVLGGTGSGSSPQGSSRGSLQLSGAAGASSVAQVTLGTFLQNLMGNNNSAAAYSQSHQNQQPQQQPQQQQQRAELVSLQNEAHWMQLAQQYVDGSGPSAATAGTLSSGAAAAGAGTAAGTAAGTVSAMQQQQQQLCGLAAAAAAAGPSKPEVAPSSASGGGAHDPSSTAESGSSVLADLGSVDTPEQGLVIYKAFLHQASEMLACAQQQQQQGNFEGAAVTEHQLGELTRSTIGRLQPFLVARGQGVVYDWNQRNLETQQVAEPPASLWPAVLDTLQLTEQAQRDALQCFDLFGAPLSRLLEERAQLAQRYRTLQQAKAAPASASASVSARGGGSSARAAGSNGDSGANASSGGGGIVHVGRARTLESVADSFYTSIAVLKALAANLERYQSLDGVFAHSLTNLLTGAQIAAACVASYPYLPRWHTMMATLKQRKQDEERHPHLKGAHAGSPSLAQRRSSRVRTATQAAREAYV